jgi:transcription elongation factor Elf1
MFLWGARKRCVERVAREKKVTCHHCGSEALIASEAVWMLGAATLDIYLKCSDCELETPMPLSPTEYKRCGFDPDEALPDVP